VLLVVGDHFFFGEGDSHVRMRDVAINSEAELRASPAYGARPQLVFETLSYLPRSTVFALQALLSDASIPTDVTLKLVSELTPEDLRSYDVVYVGFVRASGILRDYYFTRSNFIAEPPLLVTLTNVGNGERFTRSGPGPQHNRDYGLFARVTGPAGNRIVMMMGIGDVGVSAVVRAMHAGAGRERTDELLGAAGIGATQDFELLVEAEGHSRTDLDFEILGAYALRAADAPALPTLPTATQTATPELGSAGR
jgi:hypothetical protein